MSEALKKMREKFPDNQVGKLAKGSKAQTQCKPEEKTSCKICGGWHHPKMIHLDYVGHAALTDRLLDSDIRWSWEPLAFDANGLPAFDSDGGLWIKLTIDGVTRLGYGNAELSEYKEIGARQKEVIGDALRNAAMRFGAALELWHKGILHAGEDLPEGESEELITADQADAIHALALEVKADLPKFLKFLRIEKMTDLPASQFETACKALEKKRVA